MKSVTKKIAIMGLLTFILSIFGCSSEQISKVKPEGEISSISIGQNHMSRNECYAFSAYRTDESYYLNAWCLLTFSEDDVRDVNLEDVEITKEEYDEFTRLDEKYDFFSYLKDEKKDINLVEPLDMTTTSFNVSYDGESINLKTSGECYESVYNYFLQLAEKYSN